MTHLVRTVRYPLLGEPHAGALEYTPDGRPAVPITLSGTLELLMDDPVQARNLATAVAAAASVLEAEHGLTAPTAPQPDGNAELAAYREALQQLVGARTLVEYNEATARAQTVVGQWAGAR